MCKTLAACQAHGPAPMFVTHTPAHLHGCLAPAQQLRGSAGAWPTQLRTHLHYPWPIRLRTHLHACATPGPPACTHTCTPAHPAQEREQLRQRRRLEEEAVEAKRNRVVITLDLIGRRVRGGLQGLTCRV